MMPDVRPLSVSDIPQGLVLGDNEGSVTTPSLSLVS